MSNLWVASFAIIAAIWGVVCLQLWRRVESTNRMKWTGESLVEDTLARPSFHGKTRPSPIDGLPEVFYPDKQRKQKQLENFLPMGVLIAVFLLCFWGTILLGFRVNDKNAAASNSPAAATAIYVQVLNLLYSKVAVALNKRENWRTEKDHTDNLTFKMATFQVINSSLPRAWPRSKSRRRRGRDADTPRSCRGRGRDADTPRSRGDAAAATGICGRGRPDRAVGYRTGSCPCTSRPSSVRTWATAAARATAARTRTATRASVY